VLEGWLIKEDSMSERQWSLADRFVFVANEIARMTDDVDNENPHRYPLRKMKTTAEKILFEALTTANEICDTARVLKQELHAMDARNQP
jgi:hypothetical protein